MRLWSDPGTALAHAWAIAGTLLMVWAAFGYSWRRNGRHRARWSSQAWMRSHVAGGLAGATLVLLHGGLQFRGLAGVTTALVLVIIASGVVGRWLYTALPRDSEIVSDPARRIEEELSALDRGLTFEVEANDAGGGIAVATHAASVAARAARARALVAARVKHERHSMRLRMGVRARRYLAAWWVLHVPLSMAMLLLALIHTLGALYYRTPAR